MPKQTYGQARLDEIDFAVRVLCEETRYRSPTRERILARLEERREEIKATLGQPADLCVVCKWNPVDSEAGYDTCEGCARG